MSADASPAGSDAICCCPPLSWGAPYSLWLGQPFGPLTSPLHVQMALHCIRSSLSTNASRSSCCSLASPGSGFVLSTFAIISFDSPHSAVRPLSPVFQGRKSRLRALVGPRVPQLLGPGPISRPHVLSRAPSYAALAFTPTSSLGSVYLVGKW